MRLLVIGAAGFIGSNFVRYAAGQGVDVVALSRSRRLADFGGTFSQWALGRPLPASALEGVTCAIHLVHDFNGEEGARLTFNQTLACVAELRALGVKRQLFFSSYSAGEHATSLYGRTKFAIERALAGAADIVIVRPGLVLGDGGVYGRIRKWAHKFPAVPLPDGGYFDVPVIAIERLSQETLTLAMAVGKADHVNLFEPQLVSLRQLVLSAAAEVQRRPLIIPVPSALLLFGLRVAAFLRIPLPVNADNLVGLLANQAAQHVSTLSGRP